jgi:hypothetical protein
VLQPTIWQHPVDAGQPGISVVSAAGAPRVCRRVCLCVGALRRAAHAVVVRSVGCAVRLRLRSMSCWNDGLAFRDYARLSLLVWFAGMR